MAGGRSMLTVRLWKIRCSLVSLFGFKSTKFGKNKDSHPEVGRGYAERGLDID
jgi:hypothetical protein